MEEKYLVVGLIVAVILILSVKSGRSVPDTPPAGTTDEDIRALAREGRKIQAIKWYRMLHGVGLREAKEAVEKLV